MPKDRFGKPVVGLSETNFTATVEGKPAKVAAVTRSFNARGRLGLALVLDLHEPSESTRVVSAMRKFAHTILNKLSSANLETAAVVAVDSKGARPSKFTASIDEQTDFVDQQKADHGLSTRPLYNAAAKAANLNDTAYENPRISVVLVTAGGGRTDAGDAKSLQTALKTSGRPLFVVDFGANADEKLTRIANESGGKYIPAPSIEGTGANTAAGEVLGQIRFAMEDAYAVVIETAKEPDPIPEFDLTYHRGSDSGTTSLRIPIPLWLYFAYALIPIAIILVAFSSRRGGRIGVYIERMTGSGSDDGATRGETNVVEGGGFYTQGRSAMTTAPPDFADMTGNTTHAETQSYEQFDRGSTVGYIEPKLRVTPAFGETIVISAKHQLKFGRERGDVILKGDMTASALHAEISYEDGVWSIVDLNSRNKVFVNGEKVTRQVLCDGDRIKIGNAIIEFSETGEFTPTLAGEAV